MTLLLLVLVAILAAGAIHEERQEPIWRHRTYRDEAE